MSSKICLSHDIKIIGKLKKRGDWLHNIDTIKLPQTIAFAITGNPVILSTIDSFKWDFGDDGNLTKAPASSAISHIYNKSNVISSTLYIQVTAYTNTDIFKSPQFIVAIEKDRNYINPTVFKNQISKFYKTDFFDDPLAESIQQIAQRLSYAPNFINYTYKEEMIGDAIIKMIQALRAHKFDLSLGKNPFSYFTKIAFHAFCNRIKKEKKEMETILNYQESEIEKLISAGILPAQKNHVNTIIHDEDI
jgi:hypothetical protein